jgi:hypothetical protein
MQGSTAVKSAAEEIQRIVPRTTVVRALSVAFLRALVVCAALIATVAMSSAVEACPSCAAGLQARSEVWNSDFAFNLFVAVLPFLVIGAICGRVEAIGRASSDPRTTSAGPRLQPRLPEGTF